MTTNTPDITYVRRLEQVNEDLQRRNGELYVELDQAGLAKNLTPVEGKIEGPLKGGPYQNFPTRYVVLDRIVSIATEMAVGSEHDREELLGDLREAVYLHQNYWQEAAAERRARSIRGKAASAKRKR